MNFGLELLGFSNGHISKDYRVAKKSYKATLTFSTYDQTLGFAQDLMSRAQKSQAPFICPLLHASFSPRHLGSLWTNISN
jgi:hypothetical protein